ncbi:hypothetical protein K488DRAFT_40050 [Vararia minispora EC-137]|uniref:Uncharacterized protein n=1 Tax=Vararia minispora EC-137 TaxID=1314806 RepID=A0ACB8QZ00_9AGAM|nr:hypothetical protein K488DRAFT_40050 [Vararia minispora EC-137]
MVPSAPPQDSYSPSTAASHLYHLQLPNQPFQSPSYHRRKLERACDGCRRRKTRCDGPQTSNNVCTNCRQANRSCTYLEASRPRGPPKAYVNALEDRVELTEAFLKRLRPDIDFSIELGPPVVRDSWKSPSDLHSPTTPSTSADFPSPRRFSDSSSAIPAIRRLRKASSFPVHAAAFDSDIPTGSSSEEDKDPYEAELDRTIDAMEKRLMLTELDPAAKGDRLLDRRLRYHGASAPILLATAAAEHRLIHLHEAGDQAPEIVSHVKPKSSRVWESLHRQEFWYAPKWELDYEGVLITNPSDFPDLQKNWPAPDLAASLVDLYFRHFNSMFPLLHRPTFEKDFKAHLWERDIWFACVCMGVFAIASRHSDDARVLFPVPKDIKLSEEEEDRIWYSAGVKYYYAAMTVLFRKQSMMTPSSLFEVQTVCLTTHFQRSTRWAGGAWVSIACGVLKLQDVGAHRKRSYKAGISVENELWKRAYWYLVGFDRTGSAAMGRTCSTRPEDADAELPLAVDDEFWEPEDLTLAFRQPAGRPPPRVTAFILWLKLTEITSYVLGNFYVVKDSPGRHGRPSLEEIMRQLNFSMTEWVEAVPEYLKWSPNIEDPVVANQSATLFLNYNMLNILIQSALLPPNATRLRGLAHPRTPSVPGYPQAATALAVAVAAARAGTRILETAQQRRLPNVPLFLLAADAFAAVLCLDVWIVKTREKARRMEGREPSLEAMQTIESLMADLQAIIACVESAVPRWETARISLYLREAMPSPEDEADLDDFPLEVMPPIHDGLDDDPTTLTLPGNYGRTQPFFLEQDGDPSRAAEAATSASSPPVYPHSAPQFLARAAGTSFGRPPFDRRPSFSAQTDVFPPGALPSISRTRVVAQGVKMEEGPSFAWAAAVGQQQQRQQAETLGMFGRGTLRTRCVLVGCGAALGGG